MICISCSGTLGKITLIKDTDPIGVINQALLILRTDKQKVSPILLYYFLTSSIGNQLLIETAGGSAQVNIAKREVIQSIPFLLAPQKLLNKSKDYLTIFFEEEELNLKETIILKKIKDLLLSKMTRVEVEKGK